VKSITDECPEAKGKIEMLQIDVADDASCASAAAALKAKGVVLYALVNNAGMGLAQEGAGGVDAILNVNFYGPKRGACACACACVCVCVCVCARARAWERECVWARILGK
jgi:NAD(P)-dependent dehydrogenase (short-subunit alcohol dehydrogenase family)